jgi:hypothetical protein
LATFSGAGEDCAGLDSPYPVGQGAVQDKVCHAGRACVRLGRIPAEFPVRVEENPGNDDGAVAQSELDICSVVVLLESVGFGQAGQERSQSVVRGIF